MTSDTPLATKVADNETRLRYLELKSDADDRTIDVLKRQNYDQSTIIDTMGSKHALELQQVRQERDEAVAKTTQVEGIINSICRMGVDGLNKMRQKVTTATEDLQAMGRAIPDREQAPREPVPHPEVQSYAPPRARIDPPRMQPPQPRIDHDDRRMPPVPPLQFLRREP